MDSLPSTRTDEKNVGKKVTIKDVESKVKKHYDDYIGRLSLPNKVAIRITNAVGSVYFFLMIFTWTLFWLSWNTMAPTGVRFDPSPDFLMWLFISNVIQILLMPLILVGQNLQSKQTELLGQHALRSDLQSEVDIDRILAQLDRMEARMGGDVTPGSETESDDGARTDQERKQESGRPLLADVAQLRDDLVTREEERR